MKKIYIQPFLLLFGVLISISAFAQITGPATGCATQSMGLFNAPAGSTFAWSIASGPGSPVITNPTAQNTNITFDQGGSFVIECLVNGGSNYTFNVIVNALPDATITGISSMCGAQSGNLYSIPTLTGGTYFWNVSGAGGNIVSGLTADNCVIDYSTTGTGIVTITVTDSIGCQSSSGHNTNVNAVPTASIAAGPATACNNTAGSYTAMTVSGATYLWTYAGAASVFGQTTQFCDVNFSAAGSYNLTMDVTVTATGCTSGTAMNIIVNPAPLAYYPDVEICNGDTITVTADTVAGATYNWSGIPSQMSAVTNTQSIDVFYNSGNNLNLTVTGVNGCTTQYSHVVTVHNLPDATITSDHPYLCIGQTAMLYPNGGTTFSWSPNTGLNNTASSTVFATIDTTITYTVVVSDAFGCTATGVYTQNVVPADSLILSATDVTSCVSANGQAIATLYQPTNQPYNYSWSNSATTDTISNLPQATYTLTLTNGYNCNTVKSITVNTNIVYPSVDESFIVQTNETCNLSNGSISGIAVSGGLPPYQYYWSNAETTLDIANLANGSYDLTISDANGCTLGPINHIINYSNATSISGTVSSSGTPLSAGTVTLILLNGTGALTQSLTFNLVNGTYNIGGLNQANYLLYAEAEPTAYPNAVKTYYTGTNLWIEADTIIPTCLVPAVADFNILETTPLSGLATISGVILNNTSGKTTVQGDPIPGVDVSLEQNPGSVMLAVTSTDVNGAYAFNNVPTGSFTISVDVPGLPQVSTYNVTITGNNAVVDQNFYVDSAGVIDTIRPIILRTKQIFMPTPVDFIAYPNPFSDNITMQYNVTEESKVNLSIVNILGETIYNSARVTKQAGNYYFNLNTKEINMQAGIYFVRLEMNGKINTYKIVKKD